MQDKADSRTDTVVQICCCRRIDSCGGAGGSHTSQCSTAMCYFRLPHFFWAAVWYFSVALFSALMCGCIVAHLTMWYTSQCGTLHSVVRQSVALIHQHISPQQWPHALCHQQRTRHIEQCKTLRGSPQSQGGGDNLTPGQFETADNLAHYMTPQQGCAGHSSY